MATPYVDPYAVLGVTRSATPAEIKQAYFALVRAHPPEREPETFKRIRAAYERLRDPERRTETDMLLLTAGPGRRASAVRHSWTWHCTPRTCSPPRARSATWSAAIGASTSRKYSCE